MSSRALRKLQRERDEQQQLAALGREDDELTETSQEEAIPQASASKGKKKKTKKQTEVNAFQMLGKGESDEESEHSRDHDAADDVDEDESLNNAPPTSTKSKKKKKRKSKSKGSEKVATAVDGEEVDEIDLALKQLDIEKGKAAALQVDSNDQGQADIPSSWERGASNLLAVDTQYLNPTNEMRKLFGKIALETPTQERPRGDEDGRVDLETALEGKHNPISHGKVLGKLAKRQNIFVQGQEKWPLATSGGLGMELLKGSSEDDIHSSSSASFARHYDIAHHPNYQRAQLEFRLAVESMSPENMVHLLIYNPYHIVALLQVAEIARHQGDHAVTGDLLERALYTFGRSVHSTFALSLREGRARLSYNRPENRELFLTIWRYIQNLEMRGTWRTAFEWAKLLLSFNILGDPCGITLALDQYALRGRQHTAFIALCSEAAFGETWSHLPNMQISLALAHHRASEPKLARQKLAIAMHRYPYILSHLCSTLDISPLPKKLWGITPKTDAEKLFTELYVTRAKDLWSSPDATALLVEVAETLDSYSDAWKDLPAAPKLQVSLEDARHMLLLDIPALIALIPRNLRSFPTSQYDVLPPPSSTDETGLTARAPVTGNEAVMRGPAEFFGDLLRAAGRSLLGGVATATERPDATDGNQNEDSENDAVPQEGLDVLNLTLANASLSEEDRTAILSALAGSDSSDGDDDDDWTEPEGRANTNRNAGESSSAAREPNVQHPSTTSGDVPSEAAEAGSDNNPSNSARPTTTNNERNNTDNLPQTPANPTTHQRSLAARVDSDSDSDEEPTTAAAAATETEEPVPPSLPTPNTPTNIQAVQRYLLTSGLTTLQHAQTQSKPEADAAMEKYTKHLSGLKHKDQDWVLRMLAQKVAGQDGGRVLLGNIRQVLRYAIPFPTSTVRQG